MKNNLNLWVIPSFYPTEDHPLRGIFFKEQTNALSKHISRITVIYPELRSLKEISIRKIYKFHFQKTLSSEDDLLVFRQHRWNLRRVQFNTPKGLRIWAKAAVSMAEELITKGNLPNIVQVHCALGGGMVALELKKRYGIPYIVTEHSTAYALRPFSTEVKEIIAEILGQAECVIAVSSPFKNLISKKIDISPLKIDVIPNFIDTDFFDIPTPTSTHKPTFTYLTVCQLNTKKRVDRLIHAFKAALKQNQDLMLVIGGTGPAEIALKKLVVDLALTEYVTFTGSLNREQVRNIMQQCNCFVLPSDTETFGVVLIEAMSCGKPVISTKSGGPEDIVNISNGFLVDKSTESLTKAMISISNTISKFDPISIRNEVITKYSNDSISLRYLKLYQTFSTNTKRAFE